MLCTKTYRGPGLNDLEADELDEARVVFFQVTIQKIYHLAAELHARRLGGSMVGLIWGGLGRFGWFVGA